MCERSVGVGICSLELEDRERKGHVLNIAVGTFNSDKFRFDFVQNCNSSLMPHLISRNSPHIHFHVYTLQPVVSRYIVCRYNLNTREFPLASLVFPVSAATAPPFLTPVALPAAAPVKVAALF